MVLHLGKAVDAKVVNLEKFIDGKLVMMEEKINNLQSQRPEPVRIVSEITARIKPPSVDGSAPLSVFKFQFETVGSRNRWTMVRRRWNDVESEILETVPASHRNNYNGFTA